MSALTPQQQEIVARLKSGRLMICEGQGDPNSDGCGGQGYTGVAGQEACPHCYGAGVMTPELRALLAKSDSMIFDDEIANFDEMAKQSYRAAVMHDLIGDTAGAAFWRGRARGLELAAINLRLSLVSARNDEAGIRPASKSSTPNDE